MRPFQPSPLTTSALCHHEGSQEEKRESLLSCNTLSNRVLPHRCWVLQVCNGKSFGIGQAFTHNVCINDTDLGFVWSYGSQYRHSIYTSETSKSSCLFQIGPRSLLNNMTAFRLKKMLSITTCDFHLYYRPLLLLYFYVEYPLQLISFTQFLPMMHSAESDNCTRMLRRSLKYFTHKSPARRRTIAGNAHEMKHWNVNKI